MFYFDIYFFNYKKFFSNLHFDRAGNTFSRFRERGEFFDPGAQLVSTDNFE